MRIMKLTLTDLIIVIAYGYLNYDTIINISSYSKCSSPLGYWLLGTYTLLLLFKCLTNIILSTTLDLLKKISMIILVFLLIPIIFFWGIQGSFWYYKYSKNSPNCIPQNRFPWTIVWWLIVLNFVVMFFLCIVIAELIRQLRAHFKRRRIRHFFNLADNNYVNIDEINEFLSNEKIEPCSLPLTKSEFENLMYLI